MVYMRLSWDDEETSNKICQIKIVRAITGLGLKESKDLVERYYVEGCDTVIPLELQISDWALETLALRVKDKTGISSQIMVGFSRKRPEMLPTCPGIWEVWQYEGEGPQQIEVFDTSVGMFFRVISQDTRVLTKLSGMDFIRSRAVC